MKHNKKARRIITIALAVMCAFSTATAITAGATTKTTTWTFEIGGFSGSTFSIWTNMPRAGHLDNVFAGYPTIYDNKTYSKISSKAKHNEGKTTATGETFTLQKNSPAPVNVSFSKLNKSGDWLVSYAYVSGGGSKDTVTSTRTY